MTLILKKYHKPFFRVKLENILRTAKWIHESWAETYMNSVVMETALARAGFDVKDRNSVVIPRVAAMPPIELVARMIPEVMEYMAEIKDIL